MGTEYENNNIIETSPEDEDLMLPEGYGAEDDIFADPQNWTGTRSDEGAGQDSDGEDGADDGAEGSAPTPEQNTAQDVTGNENADAPTPEQPAPTPEQEKAGAESNNTFKFKVKHDREERDVEVNENELPDLWRKAQNHDRMQGRYNEQQALLADVERIAKRLGYASVKELAEKADGAFQDAEVRSLMDKEGVSERVAKAVVAQEMQRRSEAPAASAQMQTPAQAIPRRDAKAEVAELLAAKPELYGKQIPREVFVAAQAGKSLLAAYTDYEAEQNRREAEQLRTENAIHKQNAANAAKAPVKGTAAGGAPKKETGEDDFLRGFNEY